MATERLRNVFDRSLDLLDTILAEIAGYSYPPDALEAYVQRHANSVACLGHDAATLIDHAGLAGVPLLIRGMMESAFILTAATKDENFVAEKLIREVMEWRRRATNAMKHANPPRKASFPELDELEVMLRADYHVTKPRAFRVEDVARIAELDVTYGFECFYYSQHTHAELGGLIGRHFYGDLPALNLRTMTFLILLATAATPQLLKTHTPQMHVNDSTRFLEELLAAWIEHDHPPSHS